MRIRILSPLFCVLLTIFSASVFAQEKTLTIDTIFDPVNAVNFSGSMPRGLAWMKDGQHYLIARPGGDGAQVLYKVDARSGESSPLFDSAKMEAAFSKEPGFSSAEAKSLAHRTSFQMNSAETAVLINHANDIFYYEFGGDSAKRLTHDPETEVGEQFSPDGKLVSFVRNNNIYVLDIATGQERALTNDGAPQILNGRLDWVYQEELYGRGHYEGYWWSPDSRHIAFLHIDETPVQPFIIIDHIPYAQDIETTYYPRAGDPNPTVKLGIADVSGAGTKWVDNYQYEPVSLLIVRVSWTPDGKELVYQAQNREQTWLDLNFVNLGTGEPRTLIHETSKAWVEVVANPHFLKDGSFLWMSERTGFRHIYHYDHDGKLIKQVTSGDWEARNLEGVDESKGTVFFDGTEHSVIGSDVYRINLDGSGLVRLSKTDGTHTADFSPAANLYFDRWSDVNTPTQVRLYDADGSAVRTIDENPVSVLKEYKLGKIEFLTVKTRDGFVMNAEMIKPPDFDPSKKYPVMCYTYSGPHAQSVVNRWGGTTTLWHQMLAEHGYIIWICDNRSASGNGIQATWPIFHNFGELELRDLEDGLSYLKSQPYVDASRIGLWGWSFGGFMTSYSLTHSKSFKIGIAGGTVSDWRDYDSIYTERYMGLPQTNQEGYKNSSVRLAAKNLSGKLLLIHGTIDDNVHMQNTIQLVYALQNAEKPFQLMLYSKSRHGVVDPLLVKHLRQTMTDFILANL